MEPGRFPFIVMKNTQLNTPDVTIKEVLLGFKNFEIPLGLMTHCGIAFNSDKKILYLCKEGQQKQKYISVKIDKEHPQGTFRITYFEKAIQTKTENLYLGQAVFDVCQFLGFEHKIENFMRWEFPKNPDYMLSLYGLGPTPPKNKRI